MKVDYVEEGLCRRRLEVEVPAETVTQEFEQKVKRFARTLKLPGFREGKIPKDLVRSRFRDEILNEVVQDLLPRALENALAERGLHPIEEPEVGQIEVAADRPLRFRASFEVMPRLDVREYKGLTVSERRTEVSEEEVARRLESVRERAARFDPVEDRGVRDGDFVMGSIEEQPVGGGRRRKQDGAIIEVGTGAYHPVLHEKLQGARPGSDVEFVAAFAPDHSDRDKAGKSFQVTIHVKEIKEKVLPELDDELAKDLGQFASLGELRDHIRRQAEQEARAADDEYLRHQLLEKLIDANPFEPPQSLVEQELDRRVEDMVRSFAERGLDPQGSGIDWKAVRENQRESARQSVRATILLDRIVDQEKLRETEEEVDHEIERMAADVKRTTAVIRAELAKDGRLERLRRRLRREKAFDLIRQNARIQMG